MPSVVISAPAFSDDSLDPSPLHLHPARRNIMKTHSLHFLPVRLAALVAVVLPLLVARADDQPAARANTAIIPVPRGTNWVKRHQGFVAIANKGDFDLLFLGDSITDFWRSRGKAVWETNFASLKAENFGISGDRTEHVLWRLRNGELDGAHPKLVVLMIGTNNSHTNSAPEIAEGVTAIVKEIQTRCAATKILLLGVFPRGEKPDAPERAKLKDVNAIIAKLDDGSRVKYLDIGANFLDPDGTLPKSIMPDSLHPNESGYRIWAAAILPTVHAMMQ
jgi:lysophospholipase L1-like esterase